MSCSMTISPIPPYCSMLRPQRSVFMSVGGDADSIKTKPISIGCSSDSPKRAMWWFGSKVATPLCLGGEEKRQKRWRQ